MRIIIKEIVRHSWDISPKKCHRDQLIALKEESGEHWSHSVSSCGWWSFKFHAIPSFMPFSLFYWEPCRGEIPSAHTPGEPAWAATSLVHCSALPTVETVSTHELNMVLSASPTYRPTVTPTQVPNALLWCFFFPLSVFQRAHCRLTNAELQTNITLNVSKGPSPAPHRFLSPAKVCFFSFSLHSHWTVI